MKIVILIALLLLDLGAKEWIIKGNKNIKSEKFVLQDSDVDSRALKSFDSSPPCYYKNGILSKKRCYKQTGNILVTFGKNSKRDFDKYAKEQNLKFISLVNPLYQTVLFSAEGHKEELIELVNRLNEKENIVHARVEWVSPRRVR